MRFLVKEAIPDILRDSHEEWLTDFKADRENKTKRNRYRDPEIKKTLKKETGYKCVYCESKIGHNTPGDTEHKVPTSKNVELHFEWTNLTVACTECNRRKRAYYVLGEEFLDPYLDPVEEIVEHHGAIVVSAVGNARAEITVGMLEFNTEERIRLFLRKMERIEAVRNLEERYDAEVNPLLRELFAQKLANMTSNKEEYSAMVLSYLRRRGWAL